MLSFFSSRRNWDSPSPSPAGECAPPPRFWGRGKLAGERGVGRVAIPTRGHTLWYSLYMRTLWLAGQGEGRKRGTHTEYIGVEIKEGDCICPLSWGIKSNIVRDGKYNERGWTCNPPPLTSLGKFFHHDGMYAIKRPIRLCVLCGYSYRTYLKEF